MPVWEDGIGFPSLFLPVVEDTRTVILTRKEKSLIGYCPKVWEGLKESIGSRYAGMDLAPVMIRDFIETARVCRVDIIHESKPYDMMMKYTGGLIRVPLALVVPREMIEQAGLEKEAVLVGMGYHFEIWQPADWEKLKYLPPYQTISRGMVYPDIIA